jgi:CDP-glucose 4,6-dehydratase
MEELEVTPEFWSGKRVFLTGHTGFKGSWLSLWLQSLDVELTGFALAPPVTTNLFEIARVGEGIRSIVADVRDCNVIGREMAAAKPDIVIHMAAQPLVRQSYLYPVETYATNVMGTVHMLEAVRHTPSVRVVVNVTSDKCYENRERLQGYRENEPMGGHDPYSSSKGCAELVTAAYRSSFFASGVALASVRAGNVIGGGDCAKDRLIPDIINAFQSMRPVMIRNPDAIRPWQHVLEPLRGYLMLAEKLFEEGQPWAEAWNFGPNVEDARSVSWMVEQLSERWGDGAEWSVDGDQHAHEATLLKLDISKARTRLGWQPRLGLERSLTLVTDWYREWAAGADMRRYTIEQIEQYSELLGITA